MLAIGRTHYPEIRFALSSITRHGLADGSCRGALSRSSLIHLPPRRLHDRSMGNLRCARAGTGMLSVAAAVGADDFPDAVMDGGGRTDMLRPAPFCTVTVSLYRPASTRGTGGSGPLAGADSQHGVLVGEYDGLDAVAGAEFGHDA
jgi:hypothetical protein